MPTDTIEREIVIAAPVERVWEIVTEPEHMGRWFGDVIGESLQGKYNAQVDTSFRMGMMWFIFSEVMFFAAFFGALFYARMYALPWLSGEGDGVLTNQFLYPGYSAGWPANGPAAIGGSFETIPAWDCRC